MHMHTYHIYRLYRHAYASQTIKQSTQTLRSDPFFVASLLISRHHLDTCVVFRQAMTAIGDMPIVLHIFTLHRQCNCTRKLLVTVRCNREGFACISSANTKWPHSQMIRTALINRSMAMNKIDKPDLIEIGMQNSSERIHSGATMTRSSSVCLPFTRVSIVL